MRRVSAVCVDALGAVRVRWAPHLLCLSHRDFLSFTLTNLLPVLD